MTIRKISDNSGLLLLSVLVGICSGASAVVLQTLIHLIQNGCAAAFRASGRSSLVYFILPALGMLVSGLLVRYVIRDDIGHGVTRVLEAISKGESRIRKHNVWSSQITSAITIGTGGSVGAEAPIVYTGAAIGSNLGRRFGLNFRNMTILVGCGAAGAVAGIFKAPLAGVLFTLEILMFNISATSLLPLLLSTVSATVVSYAFLGDATPFHFELTPFSIGNIPFYIVLGVFCGLVSIYFQKTTLWIEDKLARMAHPFLRWLVCGLSLGLLIMFLPPLFGEGYDSVRELLNGDEVLIDRGTPASSLLGSPWGVPAFFTLVLLLKVPAMTFTNAGGGVGGTFGPTLFVGAIAGFVVSRSLNLLLASYSIVIPEQNFVLAGMAAAMAGVMKAPMTAIFLIAEISGGYRLFIPLIIASATSFLVSRISERYSIYTKRLAQTGELITHDSDRAAMLLMHTCDLVRDKYPRMNRKDSLRRMVEVISGSSAAVIAVVDSRGRFVGLVDIGNVRKYIFRTEEYDTLTVGDLMEHAPATVTEDERMEDVMRKFDSTRAWRLPVLRADGRYLGFISRSRILAAYRDKLKEFSEE
ncbi:MAG: chloride channel protein [Bacteroidales bacterium]|nr:chloride channel protein [Bacteroidales bacterium]